jgi:hypothetical protein
MNKAQSKAEKKLADDARMLRAWQRWRRERLEALLAGPYAEPAQALLIFLKNMSSASALVEFVKRGPWLDADGDVRAEVLSVINAAIVTQREKLGLQPFDDSIDDMPLNAFLLIREQLNHSRLIAAPPGAQPGSTNKTPNQEIRI